MIIKVEESKKFPGFYDVTFDGEVIPGCGGLTLNVANEQAVIFEKEYAAGRGLRRNFGRNSLTRPLIPNPPQKTQLPHLSNSVQSSRAQSPESPLTQSAESSLPQSELSQPSPNETPSS